MSLTERKTPCDGVSEVGWLVCAPSATRGGERTAGPPVTGDEVWFQELVSSDDTMYSRWGTGVLLSVTVV